MKVKLDENLGSLGSAFLRAHGFDVRTVVDQGLRSAPDDRVLEACVSEGRCLVTLDMEFSNPLRHRPSEFAGIVVIRIPGRLRVATLERALALVVEASRVSDVNGRLWIAETNRLREHIERSE